MSSLEKSTLLPSTKSQTKNDGKWLSIPLCYSFLLIIGIFLFLGTPKSPTSSSSISPPSKIPILSSTLSSDYNPTDPLMLSQLTPSEARTKSKVTIDGIDRGHSGFITTTSTKGEKNNIFVWYQPCTDCKDVGEAPLIQWFNGGPGSPDLVGVFNQIGNFYVDDLLEVNDRCKLLFSSVTGTIVYCCFVRLFVLLSSISLYSCWII